MRPLVAGILTLSVLASCGSESSQEEKLVFEGVETISESDLRELIARDLRHYRDGAHPTALDDAAYRIEYRYRLDGFDRVAVTTRAVGDRVVIHIEEGPRIRLGDVEFAGAHVFKKAELRQLLPGRFLESPPYSQRLMLLIEDGILAAYRDRGYVDVLVTREVSPEPDAQGRVNAKFTISEGKPYSIDELRGLPDDPELGEKTREFLGRPAAPAMAEKLEAVIVDWYRDHGHPFTSARVRPVVDRDTGSVALEAEIRPGAAVRSGTMNISGTVWTRASFIRSRADLEPDKEYRASDLRKAEERLMEANIFKRVRISPGPFDETSGTVPLEVEVEERETGEASVRGGYGSFERLRVGADLTGINIWGGAETFRLGGNVSSAGWRGETELGVPYLGGTELRLGISAYYENREYPSFDALSRGGVLSLSYPLSKQLTATVGIRHATIITSHVDPSVPPGDLLDFDYTAFFVSPTLDLRDNPLLPTRGLLLTGEVQWAPSTMLSDIEFWSASGRFSYYFPLPLHFVLATSFQGGVIGPIGGTNEIPISLRYFAGGTNTVRGFKYESIGPQVNGDPTGGEVFLAWQSEVRFPIWGDLQGAVFSDQGGVWFERTKVNLTEVRYSVGAGLRYATPAGALVADVGWNPHTKQGEHPVEFHLSVGFPF